MIADDNRMLLKWQNQTKMTMIRMSIKMSNRIKLTKKPEILLLAIQMLKWLCTLLIGAQTKSF